MKKANFKFQSSGLKSRSAQLSRTGTGSQNPGNRPLIDFQLRRKNRALPTEDVLQLIETTAPDIFDIVEIVGNWLWVQHPGIPAASVRQQLAQLGFHWNNARAVWQHPCGTIPDQPSQTDPRKKYGIHFAKAA